jgi:hypothetical protein
MITKDGTPDSMVCPGFWVVPLLAPAMANTQAFCHQAIASPDIASTVSATETRVSTFHQALIREQTSPTVLIRQVRPDDIVEHVVFDGG